MDSGDQLLALFLKLAAGVLATITVSVTSCTMVEITSVEKLSLAGVDPMRIECAFNLNRPVCQVLAVQNQK